jgi:capsular exopolysaccharide synthesis family protein
MSKNFDLMHEIERDRTFHPHRNAPGAFPVSGDTGNLNPLDSAVDDAVLKLVRRLFMQPALERPQMVVFAGIDRGNGCSRIAVSVAETLAIKTAGTVCLVDANFRSPALSSMLGSANYHGLADALSKEDPIRFFIKLTSAARLSLLTSGPLVPDSPSLLTSERMRARSAELRKEFDFVIVDAPAITRYDDAISLGQLADGVVVVIEAASTRRGAAVAAVNSLRASQVAVLGAVLNKRTFPIPEKIYRKL